MQRGAAGVQRLRRLPGVLHRGPQPDPCPGRSGQGPGLVRQRVGVRPSHARRGAGLARARHPAEPGLTGRRGRLPCVPRRVFPILPNRCHPAAAFQVQPLRRDTPPFVYRLLGALPSRRLSLPSRYLIAILAVLVSAYARQALPVMGLPYLFFIPVLMVISFVLGLGPGLVSTVLSALLAAYLFVGEPNSFRLSGQEWVANALYLVVNASIVTVCAALHHSYTRLRQFAATLERRAELRTRERDQVWQAAPDMLCTVRLDGRFASLNPAWSGVLGWDREQLAGRHYSTLVHPDDLERTQRAMGALAEGEVLFDFENRLRHRDGSYRWLSWSSVARDGLVYANVRDISALKAQARALEEAETLLRQSQKMEAVGQLTGGLAHDFNNLLTGVSGSLDLMQARLQQGRYDEMERYLLLAQGATQRAAALTHRLLAFSRRQTLDPRPLQVNLLIVDMVELISRSVGPGIELRTQLDDGLWITLCDANQLENALLNLCLNARDAMPEGGQLTIETGNVSIADALAASLELTPGDYARIRVSDTGVGMTAEVAGRAFDPFFTTKPMGLGTGLGLSMIYGFARQSGGQVRLDSTPGEGTVVSLYLPRSGDALEPAGEQGTQSTPSGALRGETVLVVDDESTIRELIAEVLGELGYTALEAANGAAGLELLRSSARIDMLISDVGLPGGMNGRQLADAARAQRPDLPVLFITGYAEHSVLGYGGLEPGMHVLTKPFSMDVLATRIEAILGGR
ncbi:hybrid sensor histidine kinase/response regulator [Stutzerimonas nosocomialis]|uniref:histidine kinase n=1 Tax=Stutzerimonas nosocomialis TaxID=1056496 RepID=A0A5R9QHV3_9GAMM|nr:hybrid sensor histidine kinase/response regulator [Stutzerimonas nosocomialis]